MNWRKIYLNLLITLNFIRFVLYIILVNSVVAICRGIWYIVYEYCERCVWAWHVYIDNHTELSEAKESLND